MSSERYARQTIVPGIGAAGQARFLAGAVRVQGDDLAARVCAFYLAGAGVGRLEVAAALAEGCRARNATLRVTSDARGGRLEVIVAERSFVPPEAPPVERGSRAARWALARLLTGDEA